MLSIGVGMFCVYLGYKLFILGVTRKAGDLAADFQGKSITVRGAPGTFLTLFGCIVICVSICKGFKFERDIARDHISERSEALKSIPDLSGIIDKVLRSEELSDHDKKVLKAYKVFERERYQAIKPFF